MVMVRFSKAEFYEMVLLYLECGSNLLLATKLYRQHLAASPHPSREIILTVVKHLRETDCVTSRAGFGRLAKVRWQDQHI